MNSFTFTLIVLLQEYNQSSTFSSVHLLVMYLYFYLGRKIDTTVLIKTTFLTI